MMRPLLLGSLLLLAGGQARSQGPPPAQPLLEQPPVLEVTTDSRAYCRTLAKQIESYRALPREVRDLQAEGWMLCEEGQVRGGINRLRRALMAIRSEREAAQAPP